MPDGQQTFTFTVTARIVVCLALTAYNVAIFTLAIFPITEITWREWMVAFLAIIATIGLIARAVPSIVVPGERYAYLVTGFVGVVTLLAYEFTSIEPTYAKIRVGVLLLCGIIGAYGAHLAQDLNEEI